MGVPRDEAIARAELSRKFEEEHLAIENLHAAELAALREELETSAATTIPDAIAARSAQIADMLADDIHAVLAPLIDEAVRKRILAGLAEEIREILAIENAAAIRVSGPETLVEALRERVGAASERMTVEPAEAFDIEIDVNRTRFASRLSEWSKALAEVL